jgi:RHS repeat-associated protein
MRFAGELNDTATGLYHLRARQYDAANGRFLAKDPLPPILTAPYFSTYVYANDRPTVLIDPSGMGAVWANYNCGSFLSLSCVHDWAADDPVNNVVWPAVEAAAGGKVCAEGAAAGAVAGPLGSTIGCVVGATAFLISAEQARHKIEHPDE